MSAASIPTSWIHPSREGSTHPLAAIFALVRTTAEGLERDLNAVQVLTPDEPAAPAVVKPAADQLLVSKSGFVMFNFGKHPIRTVTVDGVTWFRGGDICAALGIEQVAFAYARLNPANMRHFAPAELNRILNIGSTNVCRIRPPHFRGNPHVFVNVAGMNDLILSSRKPKAKAFREWIVSVVIPSLHQTGTFTMTKDVPGQTGDGRMVESTLMVTG